MSEKFNFDETTSNNTFNNQVEPLFLNNLPDNELWALNEMLLKDLSIKETELENMLKLQSTMTLMTEETLITTKYVDLQEKYETISKENQLLQKEIETLSDSCNELRQELEKSLQEKQAAQEESNNIKKHHEKNEQELKEQIKALKATIAIKQDEINITCKQKIDSLEVSLRESNNSRMNLQSELYRLKVQTNQNYDCLQKKLHFTEQLLREEQNKSNASSMATVPHNKNQQNNTFDEYDDYLENLETFNNNNYSNFNNNITAFNNNNKNDGRAGKITKTFPKSNVAPAGISSKYQPLEVTSKFTGANNNNNNKTTTNNNSVVFEDIIVPEAGSDLDCASARKSATIYRGSRSNLSLGASKVGSKHELPPLKSLSDSKNVKKRKLYNPNNLDYLSDLSSP